MTNQLLAAQSNRGHEIGSWYFPEGDLGALKGGRVYCTSMAALCLSEHFRHLRVAKKLDKLVEAFQKPNPGEQDGEEKKGDANAADAKEDDQAAQEEDGRAGS